MLRSLSYYCQAQRKGLGVYVRFVWGQGFVEPLKWTSSRCRCGGNILKCSVEWLDDSYCLEYVEGANYSCIKILRLWCCKCAILNRHLLTVGVHVHTRPSFATWKEASHKRIKSLLRSSFWDFGPFLTSVERFIPCELSILRQIWTKWLCHSSRRCEDTDLQLYTSANLQVQRQVIFTASGRDTFVKCCI